MDRFYQWIAYHLRWVLAAIGALAPGAVLLLFEDGYPCRRATLRRTART